MNLTSALTGPLTTDLTTTITAPTIRSFATFDGTDDFVAIPTVTATGDFEVEFEFSTTDLSATQSILGDLASSNKIAVNATSGTLFAKLLDSVSASFFLTIPTTDWVDGKLHKGKLTRVTDLFTLSIEGQSVSTTEVGAQNPFYEVVGSRNGALEFFSGVLANINFKSGWDTNRFYALDELASNTAVDSISGQNGTYTNFEVDFSDRELLTLQSNGDWLGVNSVVNGTFDTDTDWVKGVGWSISSGTATHAAGTSSQLAQVRGWREFERYKCNFEYSGRTAGNCNFALGNFTGDSTSGAISTNGAFEFTLTGGNDTNTKFNCSLDWDGSVDNVAIKRILEAP